MLTSRLFATVTGTFTRLRMVVRALIPCEAEVHASHLPCESRRAPDRGALTSMRTRHGMFDPLSLSLLGACLLRYA